MFFRQQRLKRIAESLDCTRRAGPFLLRYTLRNRPGKPGCGGKGVISEAWIDLYKEELDWTLRFLKGIGLSLGRRAPRNIYVLSLGEVEYIEPVPQVTIDPLGKGKDETLAMLLPSSTSFPTSAIERYYLRAAVNHECTHIVCFDQEGLGGSVPEDTGWKWFSEGTAEWVALARANILSSDHTQSFEFLADWCAYPERPLVWPHVWYSSVVFVDYLQKLRGPKWIGKTWSTATNKIGDDPWKRIQADFGNDIFFRFCCDAYFLRDPQRKYSFPSVFDRFGPRAWAESFTATTHEWVEREVRDFSCNYFGVIPLKSRKHLRFILETSDPQIRAGVLASTADGRQIGDCILLQPGVPFGVDMTRYKAFQHFVIVVTTEPQSSVSSHENHVFRFKVCIS